MKPFAAVVLAACLLAVPAHARQPYELIRDLQRLQDRTAAGDTAAAGEQARVLSSLAAAFAPGAFTAGDDPRNARAAVLFALSGGDPAALGNLEDVVERAVIDPALIKAARSYAAGRLDAARDWFAAADASDLPPGLRGQLALSRGILAGSDPKAARRFLDEARLLMPGTLVEEVALRRAALASAAHGDRPGFESHTRQYLERFATSIYAPAFVAQVVEAVSELNYGGGPGWLVALDATLASAPSNLATRIWLGVARLSLPRGDLALARHAAERTLAIATAETPEALAARAHLAAVRLVTGDFDSALSELEALRRQNLAPADRMVVEQALGLAATIRGWPRNVTAAPRPVEPPETAPQVSLDDPVDALIQRAEAALAIPDDPEEKETRQ